jgi:hypothetical protein
MRSAMADVCARNRREKEREKKIYLFDFVSFFFQIGSGAYPYAPIGGRGMRAGVFPQLIHGRQAILD